MITVNYDSIPDELFENYLNFLISKVYKILPMKEHDEITLKTYMCSLQRELIGNKDLLIELRYNPNFLSLIGKIEYLICNDVDIKVFRKDIFDCIAIIEKLKKRRLMVNDVQRINRTNKVVR